MRALSVSLLLRRMRPARLLLASFLLTALVTAALTAALASFWAQAIPQSVSDRLARSHAMWVAVSGQFNAATARADGPAVRGAMHTALQHVSYRLDAALWSDPLGLARQRGGSVTQLAEAAAPSQIRSYAVLDAGAWPGAPRRGQPVPAAVPAAAARQLGLAPGTVLAVRDRDTRQPARLRITGVFRPRNPRAAYWHIDLLAITGVSSQPGFVTYGPMVVSPAAFGQGSLAVGEASWVAAVDAARIRGGLQPLAARISRAEASLTSSTSLGGLQVTTSMPQVLTSTGRNLVVAQSLLTVSALQFLLLALAALVLAARLLTSQRAEESALLSARGATRWQLASLTLWEALLLCGTATVLGALAGSRLAGVLVDTRALQAAGLRVAGLTAGAWAVCAAVLALAGLIMLGPALRPATPGEARTRSGRQAAAASFARAGGDIAVLILAVIAILELRTYSAVAHSAAGGVGIDPVAVAAPALALAGVTLIPLRLLPVIARAVDRAIARTRRLGAALASWELSRRPVRQSGPVLLVVLAVGTGTLALAQRQSWHQSAQDQAAFAVGADVRVDTATPAALGSGTLVSGAAGVTAVTPVTRLGVGSDSQLLALDTRTAAATALLRPDLSPLPPAVLWQRIAPRRAWPGIVVPGRPARLAVDATLRRGQAGAAPPSASVTVTLQDAHGIAYEAAAGTLPADGKSHQLAVTVAGRRVAYPLRLLAVSLSYPMPNFPGYSKAAAVGAETAQVTISGFAAGATAGPFPPPFASGSALAAWQPALASPELAGLAGDTFGGVAGEGYQPQITGRRIIPGHAEQLMFTLGEGPNPAQQEDPLNAINVPAVLSFAVAAARAIPGLATAAFLRAAGVRGGATVPVTIGGTSIPVRIAAVIAGFPTVSGGGALIVDQAALQAALASKGAPPAAVTEWWLRTAGGAVPAGLPPGTAVASRARSAAALLGNPLSVAPQQAELAIAIASALLAVVGFSVSVAASVRARRAQSAVLSALGVTRAGLTYQLCLEQLMLSVPAAVTGLLAGVLIAHLVVPADTLTSSGSVPVPPVLVEVPLGWAACLAAAAAAIPVLVAAAASTRRLDPATQLRTVEAR